MCSACAWQRHSALPSFGVVTAVAGIGFLGYGVSLALFVLGLRHLGTARTGAYFSLAPFVGAVLAIVMLGEALSVRLVLAGCLMKFDIWGWRRLGRLFEVVGINAIFVFVASGIVARMLGDIKIGDVSAHDWIFHTLFTSHIDNPKLASLGMALLTVAFWWFVCWLMSRLGWAIRV